MQTRAAWRARLSQVWWDGLDLFFPPVCGGCGKVGERWCITCQSSLVPVPEPMCEICGLPQPQKGICSDCLDPRPPFREMLSWVVFEGAIRKAINTLKYKKNIGGFGLSLAEQLSPFVSNSLGWTIDLVVPIPLSQQRMRERGYNQVALVAHPLADLCGFRYAPRALERVKHTQSQVGKTRNERKENVRDAFRAVPGLVHGRSVMVMDDVATTGSTLLAAADALCSAGASTVYAFTLARALPRHGLQIV